MAYRHRVMAAAKSASTASRNGNLNERRQDGIKRKYISKIKASAKCRREGERRLGCSGGQHLSLALFPLRPVCRRLSCCCFTDENLNAHCLMHFLPILSWAPWNGRETVKMGGRLSGLVGAAGRGEREVRSIALSGRENASCSNRRVAVGQAGGAATAVLAAERRHQKAGSKRRWKDEAGESERGGRRASCSMGARRQWWRRRNNRRVISIISIVKVAWEYEGRKLWESERGEG